MPISSSPIEYVAQYNEEVASAFQALRKAAVKGPLDETTCELIVTASLAVTGEEGSFKVHARRLAALGCQADAVRQAVLSTLGASTSFSHAVAALRWIDDVYSPAS